MPKILVADIDWQGDELIVEMWLRGTKRELLCRLLLDTGATHIALPLQLIEELGLEPYTTGWMTVLASGERRLVRLFRLPYARFDTVVRTNLLVTEVELPQPPRFHGILGMNWLRTFRHVGLMGLPDLRPRLELHDPE